MGTFTKAAMQMTRKMASAFSGILMAPSIKALIKMVKGLVSRPCILLLPETNLIPKFKIKLLKDYLHDIHQMVSFGARIPNLKNMALS